MCQSNNAETLLQSGFSLMREGSFGPAINAFRQAAESPDASEQVRVKALSAIGVIEDINGFVNKDLMNP